MTNSIQYNNSKHLSVDMIRRLDRMTDEDRRQMSENLKIDASVFNTRLSLTGGLEKKARETIEDVASQVPLVDIGLDRWVIAQNIIETAPFTEGDASKAKENGSKFNHSFHCAVETVAGRVLSTETQEEIMRRRANALKQGGLRNG